MTTDPTSPALALLAEDENHIRFLRSTLQQLTKSAPGAVKYDLISSSPDDVEKIEQAQVVVFIQDPLQHTAAELLAGAYQRIRALLTAELLIVLPLTAAAKTTEGLKRRSKLLEETVQVQNTRWDRMLRKELTNISHLTSPASKERAIQLEKWINPNFRCFVANFCCNVNNTQARASVEEVLKIVEREMKLTSIRLSLQAPATPDLKFCAEDIPTRAPTLHWTGWPTPEEVQLTWRFQFLCLHPSDAWFQNLIANGVKDVDDAEYSFRWRDGLLLQYEAVKVHLSRDESWNVLELSARCDPEELTDEEPAPHNNLWAHLQPQLHGVFQALDKVSRLPFRVWIVPVGGCFFNEPISREVPFDLTTLLTELETNKAELKFKMHDRHGEDTSGTLKLERCFPGFRPLSIADIVSQLKSRSFAFKSRRKASQRSLCNQLNLHVGFDEGQSPSKRRMSYDGRRRVSFGHVLVEDAKKLSLEAGAPSTQAQLPTSAQE